LADLSLHRSVRFTDTQNSTGTCSKRASPET